MALPETNYWLVVEDDENDYLLFRRACRSVPNRPVLLWLHNGLEAVSYLDDGDHPVAAIISDIKMPCMSGLELLQWTRQHPIRKTTPFFILSSSNLPIDIHQAFEWGAEDYKVKPPEPRMLVKIIREWALACGERRDRD